MGQYVTVVEQYFVEKQIEEEIEDAINEYEHMLNEGVFDMTKGGLKWIFNKISTLIAKSAKGAIKFLDKTLGRRNIVFASVPAIGTALDAIYQLISSNPDVIIGDASMLERYRTGVEALAAVKDDIRTVVGDTFYDTIFEPVYGAVQFLFDKANEMLNSGMSLSDTVVSTLAPSNNILQSFGEISVSAAIIGLIVSLLLGFAFSLANKKVVKPIKKKVKPFLT